jgi:CubicO group peptidase (beta-lactamase class C family)
LVLVLALGSAKASSIQQGETDFVAIDAYVTEQLNDLGIPGMALGIVQDGQIVHLGGFGVADSSGRAVTAQTPFYIGSVTKSFTALAVMQLVEAGKLDLDAPVQDYLPWFELADKEASAKISVRNLLNHASGISEKDGNRFWASEQGLEEFVRDFDTVHLTQPVGTTYQYSNINFGIAGLIVEKVSGQSYADYVTQYIIKPLDMSHSYLSHESALADGLSDGHHYMFGRSFTTERVFPPAGIPSGGLIASVEDLSHYAIAQLSEGRYGDTAILSPEGTEELHAPAIASNPDEKYYAMGWNAGTVDGIPAVWHGGDVGNFRSFVLLMPDRESGFALLANATGYEQMSKVEQVAAGVFSMLNGKPAAPISSLPLGPRFFYWAIPVTLLLQIIGIVLAWRNRQRIRGWGVLLTAVLNLGAILLLFGLSRLIPFPIDSMLVYFPEIGYGLIAVVVLGIGWSVIYTVMYLRIRRSKKDFQPMTGQDDWPELVTEHASVEIPAYRYEQPV